MGLLRLIFIFIGIAVCSELPSDDGTSFFRSFFAFFIMLAFDYSRMAFKGKSKYEKGLGYLGLGYTLIECVICWLGTSRQFVIKKVGTSQSFVIESSDTFGLFRHLHIDLDLYMQIALYATMFIGFLELFVPNNNRYTSQEQQEKPAKKSWSIFFWRKTKTQHSAIPLDNGTAENLSGSGGVK